jgi:short-subunit dehydrogenase
MFAGKNIVITGAASGIGKSLVFRLLREKAVVWAWDRDAEGLKLAEKESRKIGGELYTRVVDVTDTASLEQATRETVQTAERIHIWVNNAGISGLGDFAAQSDSTFEKVLDVNLRAVVRGTRLALSHMEQMGAGTVVNMASVAGFVPAPYLAAYSASKHAVVGFTRALREELRLKSSSVRMVLVSPGFVDTGMLEPNSPLGFPPWLSWAVSDVETVSSDIVTALRRGKEEVMPTWNGRLMVEMHKWMPKATRRSARMLLTRSFRDFLLSRYTVG